MEEALDDPELDAVAIATPVSTHHALVSALDAGKHVFVEKPLARSTDEIVELMNQAEATGRVLMPGHVPLQPAGQGDQAHHRLRRARRHLLHLVEPSQSRLCGTTSTSSGISDRTTFRSFGTGSARCPTRCRPSAGVASRPDLSDVCFVNLRYGSGIVAHVELSWLSPSKLRRTTVVGSKKMVVYDDTSIELSTS